MGSRFQSASGRGKAVKERGELFRLLSNPYRLMIIQTLADGRRLSVSDVATRIGISQARTSQHLSLLRAHRIVSSISEGRLRRYTLMPSGLPDWLAQGIDFVPWQLES